MKVPLSARALAAAAIVLGSLGCTAVAAALPPFTTAPKSAPAAGAAQAEVVGLTASCRPSLDRFVIRVRRATPGYDVRYVARIFADGSGALVPLPGSARLRAVLRPARGHTLGGTVLVPLRVSPLCPNLRQIKVTGDFEGVFSLGLGLTRKTGFRVFRLSAPTRIVIDVRH